MRRIYTAFVSSTFRDLQDERQRLVRVLLDQRCVPLGMEFFPSAGQTQWPVIVDSIEAADFCIFVVAGRYGSLAPDGLSWTHREFREAVRQGKPIAAVLHSNPGSLAADKSEVDREARDQLQAFRKELEAQTTCRYFSNEADLVQAVASSVAALREDPRVEGWVRAGANPVVLQEADFDRVYDLVETTWRYAASTDVEGTWDGHYRGVRQIVANDPNGVRAIAADFTRDTDAQLPFDDQRFPQLTLSHFERSGSGGGALAVPRKRRGSTFAQDVVFSPPLSEGERTRFTIDAFCPAYKFAFLEDLLDATVDSRLGARTFDWTSRRVTFPTRRLTMTVYLPLALGARPRGPMLGRGSSYVDHELTAQVARSGAYTHDVVELDGEECHQMTLSLENPPIRRYYRLAWDLPRRGGSTD